MRNVMHVILGSLLALTFAGSALAMESFTAQARLFLGSASIKPDEMNALLTSQNLKNIQSYGQFGLEITYPLTPFLDVGMRYSRRSASTLTSLSPSGTPYADLWQDAILLLARVPVLRSALFRADVFGGLGGTNTTLDIRTATMNGTLARKGPDKWIGAPYLSAGASAGIGYKSFYFYLESGYDFNKVSGLSQSGTITGSLNTIQLSGPYVMLGLMFDGVTATKR